jgi:ACS family glucarate transporter-like MFS transporter
MNTGANLGGFIAPTLTPWIASFAGWSAALYFASLVVLVGVACWFLIDPDEATATCSEFATQTSQLDKP